MRVLGSLAADSFASSPGITAMNPTAPNPEAIACCGLYCGACKKYRAGTCPGCAGNDKASWCKIRSCCQGRSIASCADCGEHPVVTDCATFDNLMARFFGLVFRSNRPGSIQLIKDEGYEAYAQRMAAEGRMSVPR
jgi:hypothetical protein